MEVSQLALELRSFEFAVQEAHTSEQVLPKEIPSLPTIMDLDRGLPERNTVFHNPPVGFHYCWREGKLICQVLESKVGIRPQLCSFESSKSNGVGPEPVYILFAVRMVPPETSRITASSKRSAKKIEATATETSCLRSELIESVSEGPSSHPRL